MMKRKAKKARVNRQFFNNGLQHGITTTNQKTVVYHATTRKGLQRN